LIADLLLTVASAYHLLGALYYRAASAPPKEKVFEFPSLAVHVPAYKEDPQMLRNSVEKIIERLRPEQVIVITDPESYEEVRKALPPEVEVVTGAEKGKARALNEALRLTRTAYIMVFDADSFPEEGFSLVKSPYAASLWKGYSTGTRWGEALANVTTLASVALIYGRSKLGFPVIPPGSGVLIEKELLEKLGGWSEGVLTEDVDLALKALEAGVKADVVPSFVLVEAPKDYASLKRQQSRWAYGAVQAIKRHVRALTKHPETFFYLTHHASTWLPLLALITSPAGLSPLALILYYLAVSTEAFYSFKAAKGWRIRVSLADAARTSAAGLSMSIAILTAQIKALLGLKEVWKVTPKGRKRSVGKGIGSEVVLLLTPLIALWNPASLPLALQYFVASLYVTLRVLSEERRRH